MPNDDVNAELVTKVAKGVSQSEGVNTRIPESFPNTNTFNINDEYKSNGIDTTNIINDRQKYQRRSNERRADTIDTEHLADLAFRGTKNLVNRPVDSPSRYYAVRVGRVPGVYDTWDEAEAQVRGYRGNEHARFNLKDDAIRWLSEKLHSPTKDIKSNNKYVDPNVDDVIINGDDYYDNYEHNPKREHPTSGRRDSVLLEKIEMESGPEPHKILHVKNEPDLSDLSLRDIIPSNVISFMTAANKKMRQSGFSIMLQKVIEQDVRNLLLIELNVDELEYYTLSQKDIVRGLSSLIRPTTMIEFHTMMTNNLKLKAVYDKDKFEEYYYKMLTYFEEYTLLFRLLSQDNAKNIPPLKDYSFGLIQIIKTHIDKTYFKETRACINNDDFNTIGDFIKLFKEQASRHYASYKAFKNIPTNRPSRDRPSESTTKASDNYKSNKYGSDRGAKKSTSFYKNYSSPKFGKYPKRESNTDSLNAVPGDMDASDNSQSDRYYSKGVSDDSGSDSSNGKSNRLDVKKNSSDVSSGDSDSSGDDGENTYATLCALAERVNIKNLKAKKPQVCIYAAVYGQCFQEKEMKHSRDYSHDPVDVSALHERIYRRMYETNAGRKPDILGSKPNTKALHHVKEEIVVDRVKVLPRGEPLPTRDSNVHKLGKPSKPSKYKHI